MRWTMIAAALLTVAPSVSAGLTPAEEAAGWRMLFDGETWDGWRGYRKEGPPEQGWAIEDGSLRVIAGGGGGDIVTDEVFGDFELSLEFKVSPRANSGIIYRVDESKPYPWMTGAEYQVLDDNSREAENGLHSVGAVYDLYEPVEGKPTRPAGDWNLARIRISDGVAKHFLNGVKVAEYDMNSEAWAETIAGSKFRDMAGFGVLERGRISLQDHGNDVWFRDIRVRDLDAAMPGEVRLFNGKDLSGWDAFLENGGDPAGTWSVQDGVLVCSGEPNGYIQTEAEYEDFVLRLMWRYTPDAPGNSGVLLRTVGEDRCWPDCVEAQLMSGNAGDIINLTGGAIEMERASGRRGAKRHGAERAVGEWNEYEIVCEGDRLTLFVNGELLNEATGCPERAGTIGLQSEGVPIEFREIGLSPIE